MESPFRFRPKRCILELTYNCNLRCQTCMLWTETYKSSRMRTRRYLTIEQIKNIQASLLKSGIERLTYLGGEPFLRKDLLALAAHAQNCGLSAAVVTNGTLINHPIIEKIIREGIFDVMIFSLDGPQLIHDRIRGIAGTHQRATEAIKNIQKLKKTKKLKMPKIFLYVTVSALNWDYIESMVKTAQKLDVNAIRFLSASCLDDAIIRKTNALFKSTVIRSHSYAVGAQLKIPKVQLPLVIKRLARVEDYAKKIGIRFQVEEYLRNGKGSKACHFLGKDLVISPYGDIHPCPMLPEYAIGNVIETPLDKIICDSSAVGRVERIFALCSRKKLPVCSECCVEKVILVDNAAYLKRK